MIAVQFPQRESALGVAEQDITDAIAVEIVRDVMCGGGGVVVDDGADTLGVRDGGAAGRIREVDVEGFVTLDLGIAVDGD